MAGFGFNSANRKAGPAVAKPMGIQFVKSTETVGSVQQSASMGDSQTSGSLCGNSDASVRSNANVSNNFKLSGIPSLMSCQVSQFGQGGSNAGRAGKTAPSAYGHGLAFVKSGEAYSSVRANASGPGQGYRMPGQSNLNKFGAKSAAPVNTFQRVAEAKPVCSVDEYFRSWKQEKDIDLAKLRKLAYEVVSLKSDRPNAKDKLHSAANRVPVRIEFNTQPVFGAKNNNSFLCYVYIEGVSIASGQGQKIKDAKTNAYEAALQKILMPHLRIVPVDPTAKELQVSREPFTSPPPEPSKFPLKSGQSGGPSDPQKEVPSQHKESNMEAAGLKRRHNEYKPLDEFVIVEPKVPIPDCTAAHTLRRSADFNHMLLEYEYFFKGEAARCILRIENEILADVNGISKASAKNTASVQALMKLKKFCWIIKTKQAVDSNTKITKDEMLNELNEESGTISQDNIGNKLLRKMGWSGGGVGKDGSGIAEPVSLKSVLNREGLGLSATKGVTDEFRRRIKEVIETYAASDNQEDLVFSCDFRLEERQIIHDECRRLNLRSKSRGKGQKRYLCVRRKRSVNQLFDHLMSVGGETARYQLVPPGRDAGTTCRNFHGSQPQSGGGSPKPPFSFSDSNRLADSIPPHLKDPKHCGLQNRNSPGPTNAGTSGNNNRCANAVTEPQPVYMHGGSMLTKGDNFARSNGNVGGPQAVGGGNGKQNLFRNCPPQNRFSSNFGSGVQNCAQGTGPNFPSPSAFSRGHGDAVENGSYNRAGFSAQETLGAGFRAGMGTNSGFAQQCRGDSQGFVAQNNPAIFRPMGNNSQNGPRTGNNFRNSSQFSGQPSRFQSNGGNSYACHQGMGMFQNQQNHAPMGRTNFGTTVPPGRGHNMTTPGLAHCAQGQVPDWGASKGNCNDNGSQQWGAGYVGDVKMATTYPYQQQQQGMMSGGNFNPNMMGGYR